MNTICNAMRSQPANTHNDLQDVLVCLAAMVDKPMIELSDKAKKIVVDMIDEISGQVENDQIEQKVDAARIDQQQEHNYYGNRAEFDALHGVAA